MRINAYVKTNKPDPTKAMLKLGAFIHARELKIHNWYVDNDGNGRASKPALNRLLSDCKPNDILLFENLDHLSNLNYQEIKLLSSIMKNDNIKLVVADHPSTFQFIETAQNIDPCTATNFINQFLLETITNKLQSNFISDSEKLEHLTNPEEFHSSRDTEIRARLSAGQNWSRIMNELQIDECSLRKVIQTFPPPNLF